MLMYDRLQHNADLVTITQVERHKKTFGYIHRFIALSQEEQEKIKHHEIKTPYRSSHHRVTFGSGDAFNFIQDVRLCYAGGGAW